MSQISKKERDELTTDILNNINCLILKHISEQKKLSNLKSISKLDFLDIEYILNKQYEIYKEELLQDTEVIIECVIQQVEECVDNPINESMRKSAECRLESLTRLQDALFNDIEDSYNYDDVLHYISAVTKNFREELINYRYNIHSEMNKIYTSWIPRFKLLMNDEDFAYNKAKHLLILE